MLPFYVCVNTDGNAGRTAAAARTQTSLTMKCVCVFLLWQVKISFRAENCIQAVCVL